MLSLPDSLDGEGVQAHLALTGSRRLVKAVQPNQRPAQVGHSHSSEQPATTAAATATAARDAICSEGRQQLCVLAEVCQAAIGNRQ